MKFGAFQRSQGEVQQNVKPKTPWSTSDHVDPVGQSPCQVGPAGRPAGTTLQPAESSPPQEYLSIWRQERIQGNKVGSPPRLVGRPHMVAGWPLCSTATWPTMGPYKYPILIPCKHTPHLSRIPPCEVSSFVALPCQELESSRASLRLRSSLEDRWALVSLPFFN
jgi:hypothetical protein